jgi:glyoxylase-like metal-dependent hydrolase (beta-lactamase superfamily II)
MSVTRVHHLDCCTMCPRIGAVNEHNRFVGHVLAIETSDSGVVLVDTGIGDLSRTQPRKHLGVVFPTLFRPDLHPALSAKQQLTKLGLANEVQHILVTHLDTDHAGGLADFPNATVHVHRQELDAATKPSLKERSRYRKVLWSHQPRFETYEQTGEAWFGFDAVHGLTGLTNDILAIPLPGHTRGHTAIAVRDRERWLLHCGDGYFHQGTIDPLRPSPTAAVERFERLVAVDYRRVKRNHERLTELANAKHLGMHIFSAHDPDEFDRLAAPD